jgi:5-methylcytosine-specific restriction endonuclease McrA
VQEGVGKKEGMKMVRRKEMELVKELIATRGSCERCGEKKDLVGHHIKGVAEFPQLRMDPNNIQILCNPCHRAVHQYRGKTRTDEGPAVIVFRSPDLQEDTTYVSTVSGGGSP